MILSPALQVLRAKLTVAAIGGILLTGGHAIAKNHDCQSFMLRPLASGLHDRAPSPSLRNAN